MYVLNAYLGARVREVDGRHVGVLRAIVESRMAKVEWEGTGWFSWLPIADLEYVHPWE